MTNAARSNESVEYDSWDYRHSDLLVKIQNRYATQFRRFLMMFSRFRCSLVAAVVLWLLSSASATTPQTWIEGELDSVVELYRHLHAHPELSFEEEETAKKIAEEFRKIGATVSHDIGGHGVVGILKNGDGPILMLRTDLDGLPVTEETNLVYASKVRAKNAEGLDVGVMHACGHDIHMANVVASARYLASNQDKWSGTLMMIGQPAEERGAGARAMLADGLFENFPKPDFAIALHVDSNLEAGKVGYRAGYALANVDSVDIVVKGRGGHGAFPHGTIDPIVQAAQLVMDLQTIVSREIKPIEPAVITVGSIQGGTKHNIIGNSCHLQITVRSYSDEVRSHLLSAIRRKAKAVAISFRADEPEIRISEGTPALWNDTTLSNRVGAVFKSVLGTENVTTSEPSMGGEDFSQYGKAGVPIMMFRLGTIEPRRLQRFRQLKQSPPSLHSSKFYPEAESTLRTGFIATTSAALEILKK